MSPMLSVQWIATFVLAVAALSVGDASVQAQAWNTSVGCGCSESSWDGTLTSSGMARPFWMRPTPHYASSWARVPVTNYRPFVVNDPLDGGSVTSLQPCNTYEWQMRRSPGCSLWHRFVTWWQTHSCFCGRPASYATAPCGPTSEWNVTSTSISSPSTTAQPYYAPSPNGRATNGPATNGRVVPVPSDASPGTPNPADRRPELDPDQIQSGGQGSASRLSQPRAKEVFVRSMDGSETLLEVGPPLVAPRRSSSASETRNGLPDVPPLIDQKSDDRTASSAEEAGRLLPVSWSTPTAPRTRQIPIDRVWDDTGWKSDR